MKSVSPVLLRPIFPITEHKIAECQDEYETLHAIVSNSEWRTVTSRFELNWRERLRIFLGGNIWVSQMTFGNAVRPIKIMAEEPSVVNCL